MIERIVNLTPEKAYEELKNLLLRNNCKIVAEEHSKSIKVEQGSMWGFSPKGAKKRISFHFLPKDSGTRIASVSSLTSDWIILSALGYVVAGIFSPLFWLFAKDLESSGFDIPSVRINLIKILSILMVATVIIGIIADVYIYAKKDSFAEETLRLLP